MPTYRRAEPENKDPYRAQPLPVGRPVAVYYRQSSEAQIGNISTTLQTVDMVEHLVRLGWAPESVIMIDMDAGISGMKTIEERPGMSRLFDMIEHQAIGAVAAQDVDRFFRDLTQIQTNIFIDACRRNNVLVLTPTMVYDFGHATQGRYHMQMFREQAQRAADYLEFHIKGRLVKSRQWRQQRGMWTGRPMAPGYVVDLRATLPDGSANANHRKYVPFEPYAAVIRQYFELFRQYNGVGVHTGRHIQEHGPFFPEVTPEMVPEGFKFYSKLQHRSAITGKWCPASASLRHFLTNVVYIGHWVHRDVIVQWDNHEPIVPLDLFMYAFNRLSKTDFFGDPNPDYQPHRQYKRQPKATRREPYPTYAGLIFSDDMPHKPHQRLAAVWNNHSETYQYCFYEAGGRSNIWNIRAHFLDPVVDYMLLDRLQATTLDEHLWQEALRDVRSGNRGEVQRLEQAIQQEKREQSNVLAALGHLSNPDLTRRSRRQLIYHKVWTVLLARMPPCGRLPPVGRKTDYLPRGVGGGER
ncbi:MAG: recombinase family protein [Chloroflexi bacterium]|nr:recombinase family protein [Chloroflexota bacterium]